jgi:hypothetical protein
MGGKGQSGEINCSSSLVLTALTTTAKFNAKDLCWVAGPNLILLSTGNFVFINILHNIWKEPNTFTPQNPGPG